MVRGKHMTGSCPDVCGEHLRAPFVYMGTALRKRVLFWAEYCYSWLTYWPWNPPSPARISSDLPQHISEWRLISYRVDPFNIVFSSRVPNFYLTLGLLIKTLLGWRQVSTIHSLQMTGTQKEGVAHILKTITLLGMEPPEFLLWMLLMLSHCLHHPPITVENLLTL